MLDLLWLLDIDVEIAGGDFPHINIESKFSFFVYINAEPKEFKFVLIYIINPFRLILI